MESQGAQVPRASQDQMASGVCPDQLATLELRGLKDRPGAAALRDPQDPPDPPDPRGPKEGREKTEMRVPPDSQ